MLIALLIIQHPPFHLLIMLIIQVLYHIQLSRDLSMLLSLYLISFPIFQSLRFLILHEFIIFLLVRIFQKVKCYLFFKITTVSVVIYLLVYSLLYKNLQSLSNKTLLNLLNKTLLNLSNKTLLNLSNKTLLNLSNKTLLNLSNKTLLNLS